MKGMGLPHQPVPQKKLKKIDVIILVLPVYFIVNLIKVVRLVIQNKYPNFSLCQAVKNACPSH